MNYFKNTLVLVTLLTALLAGDGHALSTQEQADSFFARGVAAEERGELLVAANCYTLALRVAGGHRGAQTKLAALEKNTPGGLYKIPRLQFREATFSEAIRYLESQTATQFVFPPKPQFQIFDSTGKLTSARIILTLSAVPVKDALSYICDLANAQVFYDGNIVAFFPAQLAPPKGSLGEKIGRLQSDFQDATLALAQGFLRKQETARQDYTTALQRVFQANLNYGDKASSAALKAELERINTGGDIPAIDDPGTPATLTSQRAKYRSAISAAQTAQSASFQSLCNQYGSSLAALKTSASTQGADTEYLQLQIFRLAETRENGLPIEHLLAARTREKQKFAGRENLLPEVDKRNLARMERDKRLTEPLLRKLDRIIIPKVDFREATVREALEYLTARSRMLDPDEPKQGVNIVLKVDQDGSMMPVPAQRAAIPGQAVPPPVVFWGGAGTRITLSLSNVPMLEVIKYITNLTNLSYKVEPYAVIISPLEQAARQAAQVTSNEPPKRSAPSANRTAALAPAQATPSASHCSPGDTLAALNDGKEPNSSADTSIPRFTWRPRRGNLEWVEYQFPNAEAIEGCSVYWCQEGARLKLPHYWKVLYLDASGIWLPVSTLPPPAAADAWTTVRFAPVRTKGLRLAAQLKGDASAGILEWQVIPSTTAVPPVVTPAEVRLDDLIPLSARVGFGPFRVNTYSGEDESRGAKVLVGGAKCEHFLFTHTPSEVTFIVPAGLSIFRATGIAPTQAGRTNFTWTYHVLADGKELFRSKSLETYPDHRVEIAVELPAGTKTLTLKTENEGSTTADHSIWAEPKLLPSPVSAETKAKLEQLEAQFNAARVAKVEPAYAQAIQALDAKHRVAVQRALEAAIRAADNSTVAALQQESRQLKDKVAIPETDPSGTPAPLATLYANYRAGVAAAAAAKVAQLRPLYDGYDAQLVALAKTLAGKPADAAAVDAVRARLASTRASTK